MPRKATTTAKKTTGRGARSAKTRGERATGTALQEPPSPKRGEAAEHMDQPKETEPTHDEIALRAQEIWRERGFPHGEDKQHWYEAEQQLRRQKKSRR
jgi:hypothetical protein